MASAQTGATPEEDLAKGIQQVRTGAFDAAIDSLNSTIRQWAPDPARNADVARAYLYISAVYVGLNRRLAARAALQQAFLKNPRLAIEVEGFSSTTLRTFRELRKELKLEPLPATAPAPDATPAAARPGVLTPTTDADLEKGAEQARAGDPEAAVATLQGVLRRQGNEPENVTPRARALLFLAVAHARADREPAAKLALADALKLRPDLALDENHFSPRFLAVFQSVVAGLAQR
jgi:tetratricopeptide (TPR) repeat protein